jgi:hypothetical protein
MTITTTPRNHPGGMGRRGGSAAGCCTSWMLILVVLFVCEGGVAFSRPLWSSSLLGRTARGGRPTATTLMLIDRPAAVDQTRRRRAGAAVTRTTRSVPTTRTTTATTRHRSSSMAMQLRGGGGGTVAVVATFNRFVQYIGQNRSRCLLILGAAIVLESCATGLSKRAKDTGSVGTFLVAACLNICWYVNTTSQCARPGHYYQLLLLPFVSSSL